MAATNIGNPAGYVAVGDSENPQMISGRARQVISGGVFVFSSGATGVVSSGANSFVTADILFNIDASGGNFTGVAMQTTGSNGLVSVARNVDIIAVCNGACAASVPLACDGNNAVLPVGSVAANLAAQLRIGRSVTAGASGGYCVVHIDG